MAAVGGVGARRNCTKKEVSVPKKPFRKEKEYLTDFLFFCRMFAGVQNVSKDLVWDRGHSLQYSHLVYITAKIHPESPKIDNNEWTHIWSYVNGTEPKYFNMTLCGSLGGGVSPLLPVLIFLGSRTQNHCSITRPNNPELPKSSENITYMSEYIRKCRSPRVDSILGAGEYVWQCWLRPHAPLCRLKPRCTAYCGLTVFGTTGGPSAWNYILFSNYILFPKDTLFHQYILFHKYTLFPK